MCSDNEILKTGYLLNSLDTNKQYKISVVGDVLGEGHATVSGAKEVSKYIIDENDFLVEELYAADYDGNGIIKMNDVMRIINKIKDEVDRRLSEISFAPTTTHTKPRKSIKKVVEVEEDE